ncbi:MAG: hypothetical protein Q4P66_05785 [Actinomycetaceae bacterium]|nr:hypothetical protein [Actinomycetaceae bacterium]
MNDGGIWTDLLHMPGIVVSAAYLLLIIAIVAWSQLIRWKISDRTTFRYFQVISYTLIAFCCVRIFRRHLEAHLSEALFRYMWYIYYLPLLMFVTTCVLMCHHVLRPPWSKIANRVFVYGSSTLALMLLTNDIHMLAFNIPFHMQEPLKNYTYGPGFFIVATWLGLWSLYMIIYFVVMCVWVRNIYYTIALFILMALFASYAVSYMLGNAPHTEYIFVYTVFFLLILDVLIRSGAIQHNRWYLRLFSHTSIPVYLFDTTWKLCRQSSVSKTLPTSVIDSLKKGLTHIPLHHHANPTQHTDYRCAGIVGGFAVWETDMSAFVALQKKLTALNHQLDRLLTLTRYEVAVNAEQLRVNYRQEIAEKVESVISDKLSVINADRDKLLHTRNDDERATLLRRISITLGLCKRIGLLLLSTYNSDDEMIEYDTVYHFLTQACHDFSTGHNQAAISMKNTGTMPTDNAFQLLQLVHTLLEVALVNHFTTIFIRLHQSRCTILLENEGQAALMATQPKLLSIAKDYPVHVSDMQVVIDLG